MNEMNTPGVGVVLSASKLDYVPEVHCYLSYGGNRVDLTKFRATPEQPISEFFIERKIEPIEIGETKRSVHKQFIAEHYGKKRSTRFGLSERNALMRFSHDNAVQFAQMSATRGLCR